MKFEEVSKPDELIKKLEEMANRKQNTRSGSQSYICHYTTLKAVKGILQKRQWYMNSPINMNDVLELMHSKDVGVDNVFFCSFIADNLESIAMWSMYSQPWEEGVMIKIPIEKMKEWKDSKPSIYRAEEKGFITLDKIDCADLTFHSIAYTNADNEDIKEQEILTCGTQINKRFRDVYKYSELAFYIKHKAWSYEQEVRLRINVPAIEKCDAIMVDIPKDILDSFVFVSGPCFKENLLAEIRKIDPRIKQERVKQSLFTGRLKKVYCERCPHKKGDVVSTAT